MLGPLNRTEAHAFPFRLFMAAADPRGRYGPGRPFDRLACTDDLVATMAGPRPGDNDAFVRILPDTNDAILHSEDSKPIRVVTTMRKLAGSGWRVIVHPLESYADDELELLPHRVCIKIFPFPSQGYMQQHGSWQRP